MMYCARCQRWQEDDITVKLSVTVLSCRVCHYTISTTDFLSGKSASTKHLEKGSFKHPKKPS